MIVAVPPNLAARLLPGLSVPTEFRAIANVHFKIDAPDMPVMTGVELYRHLMDSDHAIPTILVTAYADDDVGSRALRDGVICYLRKPVNEKHLKRCLVAALKSQSA